MRKNLFLSIIACLFWLFSFEHCLSYAYTFEDDFADASFTDANWKVLLYDWSLTPDGYHGSAGPVGSDEFAGDREPAVAAANSGHMFYNNGLTVEAVVRVDSYDEETVRHSGGIFVSLYQDETEQYWDYDATLVYNERDPIPRCFHLILDDSPGDMHIIQNLPEEVDFDNFYILKLVFTDSINVYLYNKDGTELYGSIENISPTLPMDSGMVGILKKVSVKTCNIFLVYRKVDHSLMFDLPVIIFF